MIVYMYAVARLLTTNRRYWSNVSRRYRKWGATSQCAGEVTLSGPIAQHQAVSLTYSTSVLTRHGHFDATRSPFKC